MACGSCDGVHVGLFSSWRLSLVTEWHEVRRVHEVVFHNQGSRKTMKREGETG